MMKRNQMGEEREVDLPEFIEQQIEQSGNINLFQNI